MQPEIVIAYLRAVLGGALRMAVGLVAIVVLNVLLNPSLVRDAGIFREQAVALLQRFSLLGSLTVATLAAVLLFGPWACFRYAQWRYKGLDATAMLPRQRRELELPVSRDDAFALALHAMQDDSALYAVVANADAGTIHARAVPLRGRSIAFGNLRNNARSSTAPGHGAATHAHDDRWPDWLLRLVEGLHVGPPSRRVALSVVAQSATHATIVIDARLNTVLPAIDMCARNRRHVDAIAHAITARVQPLLAREREARDKAQLERRLLDARLQVLRAQIEPHFLYNTLANVQYLAANDPPAGAAMVGALIDYLRQALPRMRDGNPTLGEEVALAGAYLDILRIRMGSRLAVAFDVPEALCHHPLPPMMLVSLVENAIKHGLEPKPGGGTIAISAAADAQRLRVTVADDGVGFGAAAGNGIGLRNIRETLASLFGARGSLTVEPGAQGGVVATIEVPSSPGAASDPPGDTTVDAGDRLPQPHRSASAI
jgi:signal transduction histidine kinase